MPNDSEKIEDFMTLWKKKQSSEYNNPSVIGDTLNQLESLKKENEALRIKIAENLELLSRSEQIIKSFSNEKERIRVEKEEELMNLELRVNELEKEKTELGNKVKSTVKLLLEKDEEIKEKENLISSLQLSTPQWLKPPNDVDNQLIEDLNAELSKRKSKMEELEATIGQINEENEELHKQLVEKVKSLPIDYVVPILEEEKIIKPQPPESSTKPLELLCQDLQSDLNKYKKIIERLSSEKNQLKDVLEGRGIEMSVEELTMLRDENEKLKNDLSQFQKSLSSKEQKAMPKRINDDLRDRISELEYKLEEKEIFIAELKGSKSHEISATSEPMSTLVEELQKSINKLKITLKEKDNEIEVLKRNIRP
jgi:chromosome segregation ATPase